MTIVKENARQFRCPGGAAASTMTSASSAGATVNRVRYAHRTSEGGRFPRAGTSTGGFKQHQQAQSSPQCWRCGGKYVPQTYKFKSERCFGCCKTGHIAKLKARKGKPRVQIVTEEASDDNYAVYRAYTVSACKKNGGIRVPVCIEGTQFDMQLNTAADVLLFPENLYRRHFSHLPLQPAGMVLKTFDNQTVDLAGKIFVEVAYEDQPWCRLPLIIRHGGTLRPTMAGVNPLGLEQGLQCSRLVVGRA